MGYENARKNFERYRQALEAEGVTRRHSLALREVVTDSTESAAHEAIERELASPPDILVAPSSLFARRARELTRTVPIIFATRPDPVDEGLMSSMEDASSNATGFTMYLPINWKRVELLAEFFAPRRVGIVVDAFWLRESRSQAFLEEGAKAFGFAWKVVEVNRLEELREKVRAARNEVDAWFVTQSIPAGQFPRELVAALDETGKPAMYPETRFVEMGGLVSYDARIEQPFRILARQTGLVLDGLPPGQIPVVRPQRFELAVNVERAARANIRLPPRLVERANKLF